MLSIDAATISAERFAFLPLGELLQADKAPWMECLKAFLAATQLLEKEPGGALVLLEALAEAPLLRYLAWTTSADPEPLLRFSNDQAFLTETREAIDFQKSEFLQAAANDIGTGPIALSHVMQYWREHGSMVLATFTRLCVLAARGCQLRQDHEGREQWCHRALMASVIFGHPIATEIVELAEPDEWRIAERPVALRFARRWESLTSERMVMSQA